MNLTIVARLLLAGGVALATFTGTSGPDTISGTARADKIKGRAGNDHIYGGNGYDVLRGANGDDYIGANDGLHDAVYCDRGVDFVYVDHSDTIYYGCETVRIDNP